MLRVSMSAKTSSVSRAVPMIWSRKASRCEIGGISGLAFPGKVLKTTWLLGVLPGSKALKLSR